MKKINIKTVDGSRFEYYDKNSVIDSVEDYIGGDYAANTFVGFPVDRGTKYFNMRNVVSITEIDVDDVDV